MRKYDEALYRKPRWLVFNKIDMIPEAEREKRIKALLRQLGAKRKSFTIAAINGEGCRPLVYAVMDHLQTDTPRKTARKAKVSTAT